MNNKLLFPVLLVSISLMGIFALWLMTGGQPGLVNDSAAYIGGAESLLAGHGFSFPYRIGEWTPITHYPPLFSLVIAAATWLTGTSALQVAYGLNLLLFGLNITLTGLLIWRLTHQNAWALAVSVIAACSPGLLWTHAFALSEPLFLSLELAFLHAMCSYTRSFPRRSLVTAALLACLAFLTRYAGAAFYLSGGVMILLFTRHLPRRQRLGHLGLFFAVSIPGVTLLVLRNRIVGGTLANRQLRWHPPTLDKLFEGAHNLWGFFLLSLPQGWNAQEIAVMLLAVFVLLWVFVQQTRRSFSDGLCQRFQSAALIAIHGSIYLVVVILTMMFFDASTIFEARILAPFGLCLLVTGVALLAQLRLCLPERTRVVPLLGGAALVCLSLVSGADLVRTSRWDGLGFSAAYWRNSATFQALETLPEVNIYSTRPMGIYLLSGRPATFIPDDYNPVTGQAVSDHTDRVERMLYEVHQGQAVVVIFEYPSMTVNPYEVEWARSVTAGLPLLVMLPDGAILGDLDEVSEDTPTLFQGYFSEHPNP